MAIYDWLIKLASIDLNLYHVQANNSFCYFICICGSKLQWLLCIWLIIMPTLPPYAKNCINKARPKLHCNGKCQMMKKMRKRKKKKQNQDRKEI